MRIVANDAVGTAETEEIFIDTPPGRLTSQAWIKTQLGKYRPSRCEDCLIDTTVRREAPIERTEAGIGAIRHGERR